MNNDRDLGSLREVSKKMRAGKQSKSSSNLELFKARLIYNHKEMESALKFKWTKVEQINELGRLIKKGAIEGLDFCGLKISKDDAKTIYAQLTAVKRIKAMSFFDCGLTGDILALLWKSIAKLKVQYLELRRNEFGMKPLYSLIKMLEKNGALTDLTLRENKLDSPYFIQNVDAFGRAIVLCGLTSLDLSCNFLEASTIEDFCKSLKDSKALKFLNLSDNKVGCAGAIALANIVNTIELRYLVLDTCEIRDKGGISLMNTLAPLNSSLYLLYLSNNDLGDKTALRALEIFESTQEPTSSFRSRKGSRQTIKKGLQILNLSKNKRIDKSYRYRINNFVLSNARLVFKEEMEGWSDDAWRLATHNHGAKDIAKAIEELSDSETTKFAENVVGMLNKSKQTMLHILIWRSMLYDNMRGLPNEKDVLTAMHRKARSSRRSKTFGHKSGRRITDSIGQAYGQSSYMSKVTDIDGYINAIKQCIKKGKFDVDQIYEGKTTFYDALRRHPAAELQQWIRRYCAFKNDYELEERPPVHSSDSCEVRFALELPVESPVAIKVFNCKNSYDTEKLARESIFKGESAGEYIPKCKFGGHTKYTLFGSETIPVPSTPKASLKKLSKKSDPAQKSKDEYYFIVMPRMGRSLFDVVNTEKLAGYDLNTVRRIMKKAAECLNFVHNCGWIHGDFKPRNFLRGLDEKNTWKLIDFDASVRVGKFVSQKMSSAYCPPECAISHFTGENMKLCASPSFDIWSFGVVLYELLTGTPLFVCDRLNDNLYTIEAKIELMNWLELDDARLRRLMKNAEKEVNLDFAVDLLRRCLKRNPKERISMKKLLRHNFFKESLKGKPLKHEPKRTHFFLSHVQVEAAGTVKDIFYTAKDWGCICWLDMAASDLTVKGMREGVMYSEAFVQILTQGIFESAYCILELLWAIDLKNKIVFVIEEDTRDGLKPFNIEGFRNKWNDKKHVEFLAGAILKISSNLVFESDWARKFISKDEFGDDGYSDGNCVRIRNTEEMIRMLQDTRKRIEDELTNGKPIPYRRRNYETRAMMEKILSTIGFRFLSLLESKNRDTDNDPKKPAINLVVFTGNKDHEEFYEAMKAGVLEELGPASTKWKQVSPVEEFNPGNDTLLTWEKEGGVTVYLLLMVPGFFLREQEESLSAWVNEWEERKIPLVAIQDQWFNQATQKEKSVVEANFNSVLKNTEILPYRSKSVREHEYNAMIKETARRLINCANINREKHFEEKHFEDIHSDY